MGDFACFRLYFEVNAFKRTAVIFITPVLVAEFSKKTEPTYPNIC
jgi:hypothetical protein